MNTLSLRKPTPSVPPIPSAAEAVSPKSYSLFKNQRIGSFEIRFVEDGEVISVKKADGFLRLKPKGANAQSQHFILVSDTPLPAKKILIREIEGYYSRSQDYKVAQLHLDLKARP